jgi:membrane protease YdiL (CAAX protease family)
MMNHFKALAPRTSEKLNPELNSAKKAFSAILPVLLYYLLNYAVFYFLVKAVNVMSGVDVAWAATFSLNSSIWSVAINLIAMIVGIIPIIPMVFKEKIVFCGKSTKPSWMVVTLMLGIGAAVFFNILINLLDINGGETYSQVQSTQFSLPLYAGLIIYGLITPFIEELLFRAVVYNRARRNYNLPIAVFVTAVIFGVYHDNLLQAVYGCLMGVLICLVYERFGGLIYPYLMHAFANMAIYLMMNIKDFGGNPMIIVMFAALVIFVISLFLLISGKYISAKE